jgi:hypothetical protein
MPYVYTYIIDGLPRYVGKGVWRRWTAHRKKNTRLGNKLQKIKQLTGKWIVPDIVSFESDEAAQREEKRLIKLYGREDLGTGPLYNLTDGGDGTLGHRHTEDYKKHMSSLFEGTNNPFFGKKHDPETIETMVKSQRLYQERIDSAGKRKSRCEIIAKLRKAGKTHQQISEQTGIPRRSVTHFLTQMGMTNKRKEN